MDTPHANGNFEEGNLPKKFKVNGREANASSGVTYSEADSSNDLGSSNFAVRNGDLERSSGDLERSNGDLKNSNGDLERSNGDLGKCSWISEATPATLDQEDLEPSTSSGSRGEPLKEMLECVGSQYVDEKTNKQMAEIENEIKQHIPLISEKEELSVLEDEYSDPIYIQKIMDLRGKYQCLRRTRGDGNCFYRSLGYSIFENFMRGGDQQKVEAVKQFMLECKDALIELKYPVFTMEDFCDCFNEQLTRVMANPTEAELLDVFQNQGTSDFIVVWLRFLTVLQLRKEPEFYENFIESHPSVVEFCRSEVEPMYKESDHIHIIAVASLLKIKIRVEYMDRGDSPTVISHDFPEDDASPEIFLLYRPGHYDILYKN